MVKLIICAFLLCLLCSGTVSQTTSYDDGLEAFNGDFPFVAYIEPFEPETLNTYPDCLGTLIAPTWVFTTARCNVITTNGVHSFINGVFRISLGSVNISESTIVMNSSKFVPHPDFALFGHHNINNAGLIELPSAVTYSNVVSAINLPWSIWNLELSGFESYFIGRRFGFQSSETGDSHAIIRWNKLNIISNEACDVMSGFMRTETEICAFGITANPSKTPCNSNGFLALNTDTGFVLISGSGNDECHTGLANFYPRASLSLSFITSVTGLGQ